ncbi:MAG: hypothetical protein DRN17_05935 [Thermoplasmata archaeon]|nr:MAG: hypothetical protein DRN17_05935 [Thermoplasmata archaeon]
MYSKQEVAKQLRKAASEIQSLTNDKRELESTNQGLLLKIAELEGVNDAPNDYQSEIKAEEPSALQKQAEQTFVGRGSGFGSSSDGIPVFDSDLSPEQKLDKILMGESPADFS